MGCWFAWYAINKQRNKGITFLLCVIDIFSKYACVVPLKGNKGLTVVNVFRKVLNKSDHKPNKTRVDKGSEFFNISFKRWLKDNDIEMYSTHKEGKSVVAESIIRTLKNKIYKHMASILKQNLYWSIRWYSKWIQQFIL